MNSVLLFVWFGPHRAPQRTAGPLCVKIFAEGLFSRQAARYNGKVAVCGQPEKPWPHGRRSLCKKLGQYRIILSADTASEVRQMLSQKRR